MDTFTNQTSTTQAGVGNRQPARPRRRRRRALILLIIIGVIIYFFLR